MGSWYRSFIVVLVAFAVGCVSIPTTPMRSAVAIQMEIQNPVEEEESSEETQIVDENLGDDISTGEVVVEYSINEEDGEETRVRHPLTPLEIFGLALLGVVFGLAGLSIMIESR